MLPQHRLVKTALQWLHLHFKCHIMSVAHTWCLEKQSVNVSEMLWRSGEPKGQFTERPQQNPVVHRSTAGSPSKSCEDGINREPLWSVITPLWRQNLAMTATKRVPAPTFCQNVFFFLHICFTSMCNKIKIKVSRCYQFIHPQNICAITNTTMLKSLFLSRGEKKEIIFKSSLKLDEASMNLPDLE